jgi:hypothetical protein
MSFFSYITAAFSWEVTQQNKGYRLTQPNLSTFTLPLCLPPCLYPDFPYVPVCPTAHHFCR